VVFTPLDNCSALNPVSFVQLREADGIGVKMNHKFHLVLFALLLCALFQNCGQFNPAAPAEDSSILPSISTVNPDGSVTTVPAPQPQPMPPSPLITVTAPLVPSRVQVIEDDDVTLSSTMTANIGTITYRWFFTADDANAVRLQNLLRANDVTGVLDMTIAGQASSFPETTSRLNLVRIKRAQTGTFHLAASLPSAPTSVQSHKITVLENIPAVQTFRIAGTFAWRKPLRGTTAMVQCWGAGGSGGSGGYGTYFSLSTAGSAGGGGGGGGGYSAASFNLSALNATEPVVIGRGGAGGGYGPANATGVYSGNFYYLPGADALMANGLPGEESVFGNRMVVAAGGGPGTRSQGLTPGAGGAGGAGAAANGLAGAAGGIPGGIGGLAGGSGSTAGAGGINGTFLNNSGTVSSYHWTNGGVGIGGAGGGGGGGNSVGASGGGAGSAGVCTVTVQ